MKTLFNKLAFTLIFIVCLFSVACHKSQPQLQALSPGDVIVAFGDSLTYGTGAGTTMSYPQNLENITGFKVINAGVPGNETKDGLARISEVLEKEHPRLVILLLGGNDFILKRSNEEIKENLRKIIQSIQRSGAQVVLIGVPAIGWNMEVPAFFQDLGTELNVPVEQESLAKLERDPQYKSDEIHLNDNGYKIFASDVANFLKKQGAVTQFSQ